MIISKNVLKEVHCKSCKVNCPRDFSKLPWECPVVQEEANLWGVKYPQYPPILLV